MTYRKLRKLWLFWGLATANLCVAAFHAGVMLGDPSKLETYKSQTVTVGPAETPQCTFETTVGALVSVYLTPEHRFLNWAGEYWGAMCAARIEDSIRRGARPYCRDADRCG